MSNHVSPDPFADRYRRALKNTRLQQAMSKASVRFNLARRAAAANADEEWENLRSRAREIKEHTIEHLDFYLKEFSENVERQGGHVFWASTAEEANRYISDLARRRGVRLAVKGKSMMSEEIGLNHALIEAGVEAVETDFGEYIAQLAGERPSHINMPIVHKTRTDVAELFSEKLHTGDMHEIAEMAALARRLLRGKFAAAEMGITGVNFAVAETGTIILIENEGNIRLTTSLPRIHVALMGIEKVIPRFADAEIFLKLLPRSASGQKITANVSFLTGVKKPSEVGGAQEYHVVILDNGRSNILANPHLRETLFCIRCGACLNACPVYQKIGGHAYGWVYPGPIGAILTPQLIGREQAADLPFASSLCGACREVCPVKINLPDMLLHLRHEIKETSATPTLTGVQRRDHDAPHQTPADSRTQRESGDRLSAFKQRLANWAEHTAFRFWAATMKGGTRYRRARQALLLAQRAFGDKGADGKRTPYVPPWTATRDLPPLARQSFREQWSELSKHHDSGKDK